MNIEAIDADTEALQRMRADSKEDAVTMPLTFFNRHAIALTSFGAKVPAETELYSGKESPGEHAKRIEALTVPVPATVVDRLLTTLAIRKNILLRSEEKRPASHTAETGLTMSGPKRAVITPSYALQPSMMHQKDGEWEKE